MGSNGKKLVISTPSPPAGVRAMAMAPMAASAGAMAARSMLVLPPPQPQDVEPVPAVAAPAAEPVVVPAAAESAAVQSAPARDLPDDLISIGSEWECPICYQMLVEPVKAGCDRHVFCRNCLVKSQKVGMKLKCPICRAESAQDAVDIPEATELADGLRRRDPSYAIKVAEATKERDEHLRLRLARAMAASAAVGLASSTQLRLATAETAEPLWSPEAADNIRVWVPCSHGTPPREVRGAGVEEVNGVYYAGALSTYVGPTVYRKLDTRLFMFRWHRTQWVIAELRGPYILGDECEWMYRAATQNPPDFPPRGGWQVSALGRACMPAPSVDVVNTGATTASAAAGTAGLAQSLTASMRADATRRVEAGLAPHAGDTAAPVVPRPSLQNALLGRLASGARFAVGVGSGLGGPAPPSTSDATGAVAAEGGLAAPESSPEAPQRRHASVAALHLHNTEVRPGAGCGCTPPCVVM